MLLMIQSLEMNIYTRNLVENIKLPTYKSFSIPLIAGPIGYANRTPSWHIWQLRRHRQARASSWDLRHSIREDDDGECARMWREIDTDTMSALSFSRPATFSHTYRAGRPSSCRIRKNMPEAEYDCGRGSDQITIFF